VGSLFRSNKHPSAKESVVQKETPTNQNLNRDIVAELYRTLVLLGADAGLLGTIGSWGTSLPDQDVLANLRGWNETSLRETTERIEHYGMSFHRPADSQAGEKKIA
jgi:hypothetical protein